MSAAGDASLRPWPCEPLASTGCLRGGANDEALARRQPIRIELCGHLWWGRRVSSAKSNVREN